ncbi:MAG: ABC transporter permease subunit [bacterium]|nr:ABC transporter permease subunit [bacterium]
MGTLVISLPALLKGLFTTAALSITICTLGTALACLLVAADLEGGVVTKGVIKCYVKLFKSIPPLALLIWLHYAIPSNSIFQLTAFSSSVIALTLNIAPFLADAIRSGINSVPASQYDSAKILGFNKQTILLIVIFPQVIRNSISDISSWFITVIKLTSLTSIIGLNELMHTGNTIISETFMPLEIYTGIACIYIIVVFLSEALIFALARFIPKLLTTGL